MTTPPLFTYAYPLNNTLYENKAAAISKEGSGIRIYRVTAGTQVNFNCVLPKINCRGLAAAQVLQILAESQGSLTNKGKRGLWELTSAEGVTQRAGSSPEKNYQQLLKTASARHILQANRFGECLSDQFNAMQPGETKAMMLQTLNHVMALRLHVKQALPDPPSYVVSLYDPNYTNSHVRCEAKTLDELKSLSVANFMSNYCFEDYFGGNGNDQACIIHNCSAQTQTSETEEMAEPIESCPGTATAREVYLSLDFGCCKSLQAQLVQIFGTRPINIAALCAENSDDGATGLCQAMGQGHTEAVEIFVKAVLESELKSTEKVALLQAKTQPDRFTALQCAMGTGHAETMKVFVKAVLESKLDGAEKLTLLWKQRPRGVSGLLYAMEQGHAKTVEAFVKVVLESPLEPIEKLTLLSEKRPENVSGLLYAMGQGHTKTVEAFVKAVVDSSLSPKDQVALLAAKNAAGNPGFACAMGQGHTKTVEAFVKAVLESDLPSADKAALLAAKDSEGRTGLMLAKQKGCTETVEAFKRAAPYYCLAQSAIQEVIEPARSANSLSPPVSHTTANNNLRVLDEAENALRLVTSAPELEAVLSKIISSYQHRNPVLKYFSEPKTVLGAKGVLEASRHVGR